MAQEIEAKFYVQRPGDLQRRIEALGAALKEPRVRELNLRFDTPQRALGRTGQVLRLRQDERVRLTYKNSARIQAGVISRRELEFTVSDFSTAREFLEALGYEVSFIYEKFRTTYELEARVEVMLDEMPYGSFVEIEGEARALPEIARKLGLRWETSIPASYSQIFEGLRQRRGLEFRDLTFENFRGLRIAAGDLAVQPADD